MSLKNETFLTEDDWKRKVLFVPCESKQALSDWIRIFLGLEIPDCIVDESSTSSPMDILYEVYECAKNGGESPEFSRILAFASRDSFKTLGAAILEVLVVLHLGRSVSHLAAVEFQAQRAAKYVREFFSKPLLRDYVVGDNKREIVIVRYYDSETGDNITQGQWEAFDSEQDRARYKRISTDITVLICTMTGTNSYHSPFIVVDEVDLAPPKAYEEAKLMPAPRDGNMPITLLTSTRKFSFGLVQNEIDNAIDDRGNEKLRIRHWNIIDVTAKCPEKRHQPPDAKDPVNRKLKLPMYRSDETLKTLSVADYELLAPDQQELYIKDEGYYGCLNNCRLFAMCKGKLATKQTSTSKLLKPVEHTQTQFGAVSIEMAKAQLLCWKPSSIGRIYSRFDKEIHLITAAQMANRLTGDDYPDNYSKAELVDLFKQRECKFSTGMDFGYTHMFAAVTGAIDNNRCFVFDVIEVAEIETMQKIDLCEAKIRQFDPRIWPDTADPGSIKLFQKAGFRMMKWKKTPGSVVGGIETVRAKLMPADGREPELYLLRGDPGCELLAKRLTEYHWELDTALEPTDIPNDKDDDSCDALRYLIMNEFKRRGNVSAGVESDRREESQKVVIQPIDAPQSWMSAEIAKRVGNIDPLEIGGGQEVVTGFGKGTKGRFIWDIS